MNNYLTTWLHTLDHIPQYFNYDTGEFTDERLTKARFYTFIQKESEAIKSSLKAFYPNLETRTMSFITIILTRNTDKEFLFNPTYITRVNFSTKVYKFEVTDVSESNVVTFSVKTEGESTVTKSSDANMDLGDITIAKEAWDGYTFAVGDTIYLGTTYHDPVVVELCAKATAAKILEQTYASETSGTSADARLLREQVRNTINDLIDPNNAELLSVSRYNVDLTPIGMNYAIDEYGFDETEYKDNEQGGNSRYGEDRY